MAFFSGFIAGFISCIAGLAAIAYYIFINLVDQNRGDGSKTALEEKLEKEIANPPPVNISTSNPYITKVFTDQKVCAEFTTIQFKLHFYGVFSSFSYHWKSDYDITFHLNSWNWNFIA